MNINDNFLREMQTPLALIKRHEKMMPGCYEKLEWYQKEYSKVPVNPERYTYFAYAVLNHTWNIPPVVAGNRAADLAAGYLWNKHKIIFRMDETLASVLAEQAENLEDTSVLPVELLLHLPYPCIYVQSEYFMGLYDEAGTPLDGFFAWIEPDTEKPDLHYLTVLFASPGMQQTEVHTMTLSGTTIGDSLSKMNTGDTKFRGTEDTKFTAKSMPRLMLALQIILYLVSDNREEEENEAQKEVRENAKKRSSKWRRENPISSVALVDVGVHWGADFRRKQAEARKLANSEGQPTRGKVATHFRRGHWRNQAIGPRGENQHKLIWIEAMIVNPQPDGTLPGATLRKVN